jgi:hypothetical protein
LIIKEIISMKPPFGRIFCGGSQFANNSFISHNSLIGAEP